MQLKRAHNVIVGDTIKFAGRDMYVSAIDGNVTTEWVKFYLVGEDFSTATWFRKPIHWIEVVSAAIARRGVL